MIRISDAELTVIGKLIKEAEDTERQLGKMLGVDDEATIAIRNARDYLRGIGDAGYWCAEVNDE